MNFINALLIKDTKDKKSLTATAFFYGFLAVNFKLLASGITILNVTMAPFTGSEYAIAISALGAIYILRRNKTIKGAADDADK